MDEPLCAVGYAETMHSRVSIHKTYKILEGKMKRMV